MQTKTVKPYGILVSHERKYFLLAPHTEKDIWSDGTFRFLVVPFSMISTHIPRFIWTTEFLVEYAPCDEITIQINEEEE
ncbi:MAG: hypothetical protein ACW97P_09410 [Candidatus Hodarchaeales archaeon]|jgi:hypothetical protein